jgi:DNA-binding FadR family transcriptional regulator
MPRKHREALRVLIGEITSGAFAQGDLLPREEDLAAQFGCCRGVARECIRGLEERGLVVVRQGRGAAVTASHMWDMFDADLLGALLARPGAPTVLREHLECRRILEVEAAALAAERASDDQLDVLSESFQQMTVNAERARRNPAAEDLYREADMAFHRAIVDAAGNRPLGRMTEPIQRALMTALGPPARSQCRSERALPEHERILSAILARDTDEVRAAMLDHLQTVESYVGEFERQRKAREAERLAPPLVVDAQPVTERRR